MKTDRNYSGDVSAYHHVGNTSVNVNSHRFALVDKDLLEQYPSRFARVGEGVGNDESLRSVHSQPASSETVAFWGIGVYQYVASPWDLIFDASS